MSVKDFLQNKKVQIEEKQAQLGVQALEFGSQSLAYDVEVQEAKDASYDQGYADGVAASGGTVNPDLKYSEADLQADRVEQKNLHDQAAALVMDEYKLGEAARTKEAVDAAVAAKDEELSKLKVAWSDSQAKENAAEAEVDALMKA